MDTLIEQVQRVIDANGGQHQVSRDTGVAVVTVHRAYHGKNVQARSLAKIFERYGYELRAVRPRKTASG